MVPGDTRHEKPRVVPLYTRVSSSARFTINCAPPHGRIRSSWRGRRSFLQIQTDSTKASSGGAGRRWTYSISIAPWWHRRRHSRNVGVFAARHFEPNTCKHVTGPAGATAFGFGQGVTSEHRTDRPLALLTPGRAAWPTLQRGDVRGESPLSRGRHVRPPKSEVRLVQQVSSALLTSPPGHATRS